MAEPKHTSEELLQWQSLPIGVKVKMTIARIRAWINEFGEDGVYISYSGGKDSTVLSHIVDTAYPDNKIPRVFVNTGLEYPEIVQFVKRDPRAVLLRPKMNFKQVVQKYGYPFISKEMSQVIYEARRGGKYMMERALGIGKHANSRYNAVRWKRLLDEDAPRVSHKCCAVMKKNPAKKYEHETGRVPITGEMAEESMIRKQKWLQNGCNGFNLPRPKSTPMAFWREQDVLQYIRINNLEIASVYGDIVSDTSKDNVAEGQMRLEDIFGGECKWRTTGCSRTGCMFCGYGAHLHNELRFVNMKRTHPKVYEWIMKPVEQGGLGYKEVIDWLNANCGTSIKY